jgi:Arc/MetJ family transcription regulator
MSPRSPAGPRRTRKNMDMDADKLAHAQQVLGARTETEAVDMALDYVLYQAEVFDALDRLTAAGGLVEAFTSPARAPRTRRRVAEP